MLDFELLRAFVAVAECGGFHRAAERLNLTQSTVSQQIQRLELETKRPLFRRTTRSVALDRRWRDAARRRASPAAARGELPVIRLAGAAAVWHGASRRGRGGRRWLAAFGARPLRHAASRRENSRCRSASARKLIEQLDAGRLDVVFAKRPLGTSKGRLVWREPLVWVAADAFDLVPGAALPLAPVSRAIGFSRGSTRRAQ